MAADCGWAPLLAHRGKSGAQSAVPAHHLHYFNGRLEAWGFVTGMPLFHHCRHCRGGAHQLQGPLNGALHALATGKTHEPVLLISRAFYHG